MKPACVCVEAIAALSWLIAGNPCFALRALYDFTPDGPVDTDPVVAAYSADRVPGAPDLPLLAMVNGASFTDANALGPSLLGSRLGTAGLVAEPVEPTDQDNHYGFWVNKNVLPPHADWTFLMWFNRRDAENLDFLFYVGTGDGFGGTGPETYVYAHPDGTLVAENRSSNSVVDMQLAGGQIVPGTWQQLGLVRRGADLELYLDGILLGSDPSVALTSFDDPANTVVVLGAAKWLRLPNMRARVFDGLLDQVEIYDGALAPPEIRQRYLAFAGPVVPEPTALSLAAGLAWAGCCVRRRF